MPQFEIGVSVYWNGIIRPVTTVVYILPKKLIRLSLSTATRRIKNNQLLTAGKEPCVYAINNLNPLRILMFFLFTARVL